MNLQNGRLNMAGISFKVSEFKDFGRNADVYFASINYYTVTSVCEDKTVYL